MFECDGFPHCYSFCFIKGIHNDLLLLILKYCYFLGNVYNFFVNKWHVTGISVSALPCCQIT